MVRRVVHAELGVGWTSRKTESPRKDEWEMKIWAEVNRLGLLFDPVSAAETCRPGSHRLLRSLADRFELSGGGARAIASVVRTKDAT
jgi:hypothetical protein